MPVLYNKKKYIPGVYKNPSNYDNIKIYIVVPDDPYDASIYGVFRDKRKAELYAEIHDLVVTELETMDEEEIVFGWKVSAIFMNNPKKATIYIYQNAKLNRSVATTKQGLNHFQLILIAIQILCFI